MSDDLRRAAGTVLRHLLEVGEAELPGVGTLHVRVRPERHGIDPITGQPMHVPERRVLALVIADEPDPRLGLAKRDERG